MRQIKNAVNNLHEKIAKLRCGEKIVLYSILTVDTCADELSARLSAVCAARAASLEVT